MSATNLVPTEIPVTWKPTLAIWWFMIWRTTVLSVLVSIIGNSPSIERFWTSFMDRTGLIGILLYFVFLACFVVFGFFVGALIIRGALKKRYKDFRIALISN